MLTANLNIAYVDGTGGATSGLVDALAVFGCGDYELLAGSNKRRSGGDWLQVSGDKVERGENWVHQQRFVVKNENYTSL